MPTIFAFGAIYFIICDQLPGAQPKSNTLVTKSFYGLLFICYTVIFMFLLLRSVFNISFGCFYNIYNSLKDARLL